MRDLNYVKLCGDYMDLKSLVTSTFHRKPNHRPFFGPKSLRTELPNLAAAYQPSDSEE